MKEIKSEPEHLDVFAIELAGRRSLTNKFYDVEGRTFTFRFGGYSGKVARTRPVAKAYEVVRTNANDGVYWRIKNEELLLEMERQLIAKLSEKYLFAENTRGVVGADGKIRSHYNELYSDVSKAPHTSKFRLKMLTGQRDFKRLLRSIEEKKAQEAEKALLDESLVEPQDVEMDNDNDDCGFDDDEISTLDEIRNYDVDYE